MKKSLIVTAFISAVIGFIAGNAFWYLASPLWIDNVVEEKLSAELGAKPIFNGAFKDADSVHQGRGKATILKTAGGDHILRFTNFKVTNGPDLKVYLVQADNIKTGSDLTQSQWVSLGKLKGNIGDQNYTIATNIKIEDYGSVVIWCEQFGVLFSSASLQPAS